MGGGCIELEAYGTLDPNLTGNPQFSYFKSVYRRHTNFSIESIEQNWNVSLNLGKKVSCTLSKTGDLIKNVYIETKGAIHDNRVHNPGPSLIKKANIEIGGNIIDEFSGRYISHYLSLKSGGGLTSQHIKPRKMISNGIGTSHLGGFKNETRIFFIDLPFWFTKHSSLALPIVALQNSNVTINVHVAAKENGASWNKSAYDSIDYGKLYCDYIFLDVDEKKRFVQTEHEYLIEQVDEQISKVKASNNNTTYNNNVKINFNHPVKELMILFTGTAVDNESTIASADIFSTLDGYLNPFESTIKLQLNGQDRFSERCLQYFSVKQVADYYGGMGYDSGDSSYFNDGICLYSFALEPDKPQPSGTCNFSKIDDARLITKLMKTVSVTSTTPSDFNMYIYARNYNILRIHGGRGGLAYGKY